MSVAQRTLSPKTASADAWDALVDASPQGNLFCRRWWLDAVCSEGYELIEVEQNGQLAAGMALPWGPHGRRRSIRMPRLTQTLGPLLRPAEAQKYETRLSDEMELLRELVARIPSCHEFSINCHYRLDNWLPFYWAGYRQTTRYTYVLEDLGDLESVYRGMSAKTRNTIRKAEKAGIAVEESDDFDAFLRLLEMTFTRQEMPLPYSRALLRRLDLACQERNARKLLFARDAAGAPHAAIYLVHDPKCAYYLMQGTDPALRASGAPLLAQWRAIQLAASLSRRYDFEGSMIEGVEHVFRSFGAVQKPYSNIFRPSNEVSLRDVLSVGYRYLRSHFRRRS